jgi:hypothetical protein
MVGKAVFRAASTALESAWAAVLRSAKAAIAVRRSVFMKNP